MRNLTKSLALCATLWAVFARVAPAAVTAVDVSPSSANAPASAKARTVSITWRVVNNTPGATILSPGALIRTADGKVVRKVDRSFAKKVNCPKFKPCFFSESVTFPVAAAFKQGYRRLFLTRPFRDSSDDATQKATMVLRILGGGGGGGGGAGGSAGAPSDLVVESPSNRPGSQAVVVPGRTRPTPVGWSVKLPGGGQNCPSGGCTIQSAGATFKTPDGVVIGTKGTPLLGQGAGDVLVLNETVVVPPSVIAAAQAAGATEIVYERTFTDGTHTAVGTQVFKIASVGAAGFAVDRLALEFSDGEVQSIVEQGEPLRARAELTYTGRGLLQGRWEVSLPASLGGAPMFRSLGLVRRQLSGPERLVLESPPLPTAGPGLYIVRLRLRQPVLPGSTPEIQYYVNPASARAARALTLLAPEPGTALRAGMEVRWRAVPGSRAYYVELFSEPPGQGAVPVGGMVLDGSAGSARLSAAALAQLDHPEAVYLRVLAVGARGEVLAASEVVGLNGR